MKINTSVELMTITPEIAAEWLSEKWGEQRSVRNAHVKRLASDMLAGRFKTSPDAILRVKGKLANGQHRLSAVIQSGKPQQFIVLESNDEELYKVVDAGLRRTVSDGLIGVKCATTIPSVARWVQAYEAGVVKPSAGSGAAAIATRTGSSPSQTELIDYCIDNQQILGEAVSFVAPLYDKTALFPLSIGSAIYAIAASHGEEYLESAKKFLTEVYLTGGNSSAGDLRNRLIANKGARAKLHLGFVFCLSLKAFRQYHLGIRSGVLRWNESEGIPVL